MMTKKRIPVWIQLKDMQYQQRLTAYLRRFQSETIEIREKWDEGVRRVTDEKEDRTTYGYVFREKKKRILWEYALIREVESLRRRSAAR